MSEPRIGSGLRHFNRAPFTPEGRRRPELTDEAVRKLLIMFNALRVVLRVESPAELAELLRDHRRYGPDHPLLTPIMENRVHEVPVAVLDNWADDWQPEQVRVGPDDEGREW